MKEFRILSDNAKALAALLKPQQRHALPPEVIADACRTIERLMATLLPHLPPSAEEKRQAKAHPKASQITLFTTADPERKRYFNLAYFQKRFRSLPRDMRKLLFPTAPKTITGFRDALMLYYFRAGTHSGRDLLSAFLAELESEYLSLPQVQHHNRMKSLYRELLVIRSPADVASRLSQEFADDKDLVAFAKINKLKIPAQKRGKDVPRTTPHERLAQSIFDKGSLVRLDVG